MKDGVLYLVLSVFCGTFFLSGSLSAQVSTLNPAAVSGDLSVEKNEVNLIHPGDLVDVDVIGSVEYDWRGKLNPEGFLDGIDFVENSIYGLCRSEESVAEAVGKAYGKILREPKVVVKILDRSNRPLSLIYGAVRTPQRLQIKRPILLNELLILAGGLTDKASGEIQVYRPVSLNCRQQVEKSDVQTAGVGENRKRFVPTSSDNTANYINIRIIDLLKGRKDANPQILSGDIITVAEAESIYVIGGVVNPGQVSMNGQMTLSRAVDSAGGIVKGGDLKKVAIYRREIGESRIVEADLEKIRAGQTADIILKAADIVEINQRGGEKRKFPPILRNVEGRQKNALNLPLRVVD